MVTQSRNQIHVVVDSHMCTRCHEHGYLLPGVTEIVYGKNGLLPAVIIISSVIETGVLLDIKNLVDPLFSLCSRMGPPLGYKEPL